MKLHNTMLYGVISNTGFLQKVSKKAYTGFCTIHSKYLMSSFLRKTETKYFHITSTTEKRLGNIPVDKISGNILAELKPEKGLVYFDSGLHFLYSITKTGVYIMSSTGKYQKRVNDPSFTAGQAMDGFLYYDFLSDGVECYINNPVDVLTNQDTLLLKDIDSVRIMKRMSDAMEKGDTSFRDKYRPDYETKWGNTKLCLQAFMFIFFAKVISTTRVSEESSLMSPADKLRRKKPKNLLNVIQVDTYYDETIKVINPFGVAGHFRRQPCGKDRADRKTIYIDSFMKTGYERKATKLKLNR